MQYSFPSNDPYLQSIYKYSLVGYSLIALAWSAFWMKGWERYLAQIQVDWNCMRDNIKVLVRKEIRHFVDNVSHFRPPGP